MSTTQALRAIVQAEGVRGHRRTPPRAPPTIRCVLLCCFLAFRCVGGRLVPPWGRERRAVARARADALPRRAVLGDLRVPLRPGTPIQRAALQRCSAPCAACNTACCLYVLARRATRSRHRRAATQPEPSYFRGAWRRARAHRRLWWWRRYSAGWTVYIIHIVLYIIRGYQHSATSIRHVTYTRLHDSYGVLCLLMLVKFLLTQCRPVWLGWSRSVLSDRTRWLESAVTFAGGT
jgi:hypothetical protein